VRVIGNADATRFGDPFQPRGDVDAIAEDVVVVDDDIANVNADPEFDTLVQRHPGFLLGHAGLNFDGAARGIDRAGELHQKAVPGRFDDPAPMLLYLEVDDGFSNSFQPG
jgi:hypothetical protein